jgi:ATP-dependent helicase/nuclease subunit B
MADDFVHGRAEVNPRDFPKTCERCGLQSVCRVQEPENRSSVEEDSEAGDATEE